MKLFRILQQKNLFSQLFAQLWDFFFLLSWILPVQFFISIIRLFSLQIFRILHFLHFKIFSFRYVSSVDIAIIRTFQADKFSISLSIRHLPYQKFRIILNIVLIVNEFECCVSYFFSRSTDSSQPPVHDQSTAVVLVFSSLLYTRATQLRKKFFASTQQKTLEAAEFQMEEKKISYVYNEWMGKAKKKKYTNVQKSHFYLLFAPLPPCLLLL